MEMTTAKKMEVMVNVLNMTGFEVEDCEYAFVAERTFEIEGKKLMTVKFVLNSEHEKMAVSASMFGNDYNRFEFKKMMAMMEYINTTVKDIKNVARTLDIHIIEEMKRTK